MRWQPRDLAGNEISICDQVKTIQLFVEREQTDYLLDMLNEIELKYRLSLIPAFVGRVRDMDGAFGANPGCLVSLADPQFCALRSVEFV
jgi:hypothetical protein